MQQQGLYAFEIKQKRSKKGKVRKREKIYSFVLIIISLEPVIQLSKNLKLPYKKFARKWRYSTRRILQLCGLLFATFFAWHFVNCKSGDLPSGSDWQYVALDRKLFDFNSLFPKSKCWCACTNMTTNTQELKTSWSKRVKVETIVCHFNRYQVSKSTSFGKYIVELEVDLCFAFQLYLPQTTTFSYSKLNFYYFHHKQTICFL